MTRALGPRRASANGACHPRPPASRDRNGSVRRGTRTLRADAQALRRDSPRLVEDQLPKAVVVRLRRQKRLNRRPTGCTTTGSAGIDDLRQSSIQLPGPHVGRWPPGILGSMRAGRARRSAPRLPQPDSGGTHRRPAGGIKAGWLVPGAPSGRLGRGREGVSRHLIPSRGSLPSVP